MAATYRAQKTSWQVWCGWNIVDDGRGGSVKYPNRVFTMQCPSCLEELRLAPHHRVDAVGLVIPEVSCPCGGFAATVVFRGYHRDDTPRERLLWPANIRVAK